MNLRTDDDTDRRIEALAARWGVSKQAAVIRAISMTHDRETGLAEVDGLLDETLARYGDALHRLGTV